MPNLQTPPRRFTRRQFISAVIAAPILAGLYSWQVEPHWLDFVYRDLAISNLPLALVGRRLVQLSDIHIGPQVDDGYLINTFQRVSRLEPDIVVHTGDLVTYRGAKTLEQAKRVLRYFPHGRLGTAAILGNHDYGQDWAESSVAAAVEGVMTAAGVTVLRNTRTTISGLHVIGLDDLWSGRFSGESAFAGYDPAQPGLVLCHNPDCCDLPVWQNYRGWILAGHTHGGQCRPPFLPPPLLSVRNRRYTSGAFELGHGRQLYINRGVGHLLQTRFNARPEVTVLRLVAA